MCLIALAWNVYPRWPLVLAANRDEFHARPTWPLAAWDDAPGVIGGRDALHGGSWMALRGRRLAAVTNVRGGATGGDASRGRLVADFVAGDASVDASIDALQAAASGYRLFNLLLHDGDTLVCLGNAPSMHARLAPGIHGVSNGAFDAPWPKVRRLCDALGDWLGHLDPSTEMPDTAALFAALADTTLAPDADLPDTGIGLERERWLSSAFIEGETYGTRASTVVLMGHESAQVIERRFGPNAVTAGETRIEIAYG